MDSISKKRPTAHDVPALVDSIKGRLNALVICLSRSWGGLEQIATRDVFELGRLGLKVKYLCLKDSPLHEHLQIHPDKDKIEIVPLDFSPRDYFDFKLRKILLQLNEDQNVNLIHCHQTTLLASVVPWFLNRKNMVLLASRHILNSHNKKNIFHALLYRRLDALIVMSEALKQNILDTHPLKERQLKVIHYGLDFKRFDSEKRERETLRKQWGADQETAVIGLVGRIDPAKGQDIFLKAAGGLLRQLPKNYTKLKFVIVGEQTLGGTSNYLEELHALVREFQMESSVVFAGFQRDIPKMMSAFDVFVMPSKQEAFGLVAIEAMAMKCPIIISRGGSASEIVGENEEFGLLVRPFDAFDLQNKLRFILENPELRQEMSERARQHVVEHYDSNIRLQNTLDLYERMLRRRGM